MRVSIKFSVKLLAALSAVLIALSIAVGCFRSNVTFADEHVHTFSEELSQGYKNHSHKATCGCDLEKDVEPHSLENGVCTECGWTFIADPSQHAHTYKTAYSKDSANHWLESSCGHNIIKNLAPHTMGSNGCTVCGYGATTVDPDPIDPDPDNPDPEKPEEPAPIVPPEPAEVPEGVNSAGGYNESLYAEWAAKSVNEVTAYYKEESTAVWTKIDDELIRMTDSNTARVDAVGLKAGKYSLKISAGNGDLVVENITVTAHDRSGYAHFNYTQGIGAYNDDGTLKDDTIVIYLTNENKDTVMDTVEEVQSCMFNIPKGPTGSNEWNGKKASGIGWWLNNTQYTKAEKNTSGVVNASKSSNTYDPNGAKIGFVNVNNNHPIVIRIIGTVETPEGLTAYNSVNEGGTVGDNGHMARMKDLKNLTIEGIGEDATVKGWGFHFIASDTSNGKGSSFEVRNITFTEYPEDAVGMEGVQSGSTITAPVTRCWIHNNVFLPGYCANPAESDKKEGDGSCDFKRGEYYTLSYNYFTNCHKTNLVGSSDSSLQYNITMHHNWWNECGSRMPLTRQANVHFYNNYIFGDPNNSAVSLSYVTSLRANCLLFSESNYYDGSKNVTDGKTGGTGVAWGNIYYSTTGTNLFKELSSREQLISGSKCAYNGTSYADFYVNSKTFYYDAQAKRSDCLIDNAVTARRRVMMYAGVNGFGKSEEQLKLNEYEPKSAVTVADNQTLTVDLSKVAKGESTVSNVLFAGITGVSGGTIKGKGQIATFTLTVPTFVEIQANGVAGNGELMCSDGRSFGHNFGTYTGELPAGTYFIASSSKDKELTLTKLEFTDAGNSSDLRVQSAIDAINAIGEVTLASGNLIAVATRDYNALTASEKAAFDPAIKAKLDNAVKLYDNLVVQDVIQKIDAIGEVNADSYGAITRAQEAYNSLTTAQKNMVTNFSVLDDALKAFASFAVDNVINLIEALPDVSEIAVDDEEAIQNAVALYEEAEYAYVELNDGSGDEGDPETSDQQAQVTNKDKLFAGLGALRQLEKLFEFKAMLADLDVATLTVKEGAELEHLYEQLTQAQKSVLTASENEKYTAVIAAYKDLANRSVSLSFTSGTDSYNNSAFTYSGTTKTESAQKVTVDGVTYTTSLKMESKTNVSFTASKDMKVTIYCYEGCAGNKIKVDGTSYTIGADGTVEVTLSETADNLHTITKDSTNVFVFLISVG